MPIERPAAERQNRAIAHLLIEDDIFCQFARASALCKRARNDCNGRKAHVQPVRWLSNPQFEGLRA